MVGQRNPTWTKDELILALDLYFRHNPQHISQFHPEVVALSQVLNALPAHTDRPDAVRFRNPNGVYMKLCNFLRLDPSYTQEGRKGLEHGSIGEEGIWNEFAADRDRLVRLAASIRAFAEAATANAVAATDSNQSLAVAPDGESEPEEGPEGRVLIRQHKLRERNTRLVKRKKQLAMREAEALPCEICGFSFRNSYGELGDGFIECHHTTPLSQLRPGQITRIEDLALVCANCHRMLHRGGEATSMDLLRDRIRFGPT